MLPLAFKIGNPNVVLLKSMFSSLGNECTTPVLFAMVTLILLVKSDVSKLEPNGIVRLCTKVLPVESPFLNKPKFEFNVNST